MEHYNGLTPESPKRSLFRRATGKLIPVVHLVIDQLSTADNNPHPGRILSSAMDERHMNIPDYPPEDNDVH